MLCEIVTYGSLGCCLEHWLERETGRERVRQIDSETETERLRYRERGRQKQRVRETERDTEGYRDRDTKTEREREVERDREAERGREGCLHGKPASLAEEESGKKFNVILFLPTGALSCIFLCRVLGTV